MRQMVKRKIIKIDESKFTGCGECLPDCPEGALRIIDGKARLSEDALCDGLGACLGHCPEGALSIEEREAQVYDAKKVREHGRKQGISVVRAHAEHPKAHNAQGYIKQTREVLNQQGEETANFRGCPGAKPRCLNKTAERPDDTARSGGYASELRQWPVQLALVPPNAPLLYVHMEVPCCSGLLPVLQEALAEAGKEHIPFRDIVVSVEGKIKVDPS